MNGTANGEREELFHDFFAWLQYDLGKSGEDGLSWSMALNSSQNIWNLFEGTHVLTLMFFAGTIWIIDLRMMGLAFRNVPFSRLNDRVLPITMAAFGVMVFTGLVTFFGRQPATFYYHDVWFRLKMIFLVIAAINIFWFHFMVQKNQAEWDSDPKPPSRVRISGAISMTCWILVIIFGRFIAYDWYKCAKLEPGSFLYTFAECAQMYSAEEEELNSEEEELLGDDVDPLSQQGGNSVFGAPPADDAAPADEAAPPADGAPPPDPGAEPQPLQPQPTPGQGG